MKIGMILDKEFPSDTRVENEIIALENAGFDVYILSLNFGSEKEFDTFHKATIKRITKSKIWIKKLRALTNTVFNFYPNFWAKHIIGFVNEYEIDALHIHDLYMFGAGFLAKKKLKKEIKIVGDLHENYVDGLKGYKFSSTFPGNVLIPIKKWRKIEKNWISHLDYAITVVKEMKNRVSKFISSEKIYIYENCVKTDDFLNYQIDEKIIEKYKNNFVISYIGGLDYHRGVATVIESMQYLDEIGNLKFCVVGTGKNLKELKNLAKKLNVIEKVEFEGWQPPNKLPNYFQISDIGIIPHFKSVQTDNSSPNKLYQYMLMKKPIIATNCNSIQRIIEETKAGLIYQSGKPMQLAEKILKLYENKKLRKEMGICANKAVLEKYNWEKTSKNLIELYKNIQKINSKNTGDRYAKN